MKPIILKFSSSSVEEQIQELAKRYVVLNG
jgi:hypothetical protein